MKLVLAIVSHDDRMVLVPELIKMGYFVTTLSTTGGFLNAGNSTLLIVTEDERIPGIKEVFSEHCSKRRKIVPSTDSLGRGVKNGSLPEEVTVGGATIFVLNVDSMEKFM